MRGSTIVAIVVAVVLVLYFAYVSAETAETQRLQGPAVIALVQEQFEPSPKLQAMHPIGNFKWVATPNAVDCKFQRPQVKNCWEVYFGANVEGPDLDGRAPGKIEANFIVDGDTMRLVGRPQTGPGMFVRKGRAAVP